MLSSLWFTSAVSKLLGHRYPYRNLACTVCCMLVYLHNMGVPYMNSSYAAFLNCHVHAEIVCHARAISVLMKVAKYSNTCSTFLHNEALCVSCRRGSIIICSMYS